MSNLTSEVQREGLALSSVLKAIVKERNVNSIDSDEEKSSGSSKEKIRDKKKDSMVNPFKHVSQTNVVEPSIVSMNSEQLTTIAREGHKSEARETLHAMIEGQEQHRTRHGPHSEENTATNSFLHPIDIAFAMDNWCFDLKGRLIIKKTDSHVHVVDSGSLEIRNLNIGLDTPGAVYSLRDLLLIIRSRVISQRVFVLQIWRSIIRNAVDNELVSSDNISSTMSILLPSLPASAADKSNMNALCMKFLHFILSKSGLVELLRSALDDRAVSVVHVALQCVNLIFASYSYAKASPHYILPLSTYHSYLSKRTNKILSAQYFSALDTFHHSFLHTMNILPNLIALLQYPLDLQRQVVTLLSRLASHCSSCARHIAKPPLLRQLRETHVSIKPEILDLLVLLAGMHKEIAIAIVPYVKDVFVAEQLSMWSCMMKFLTITHYYDIDFQLSPPSKKDFYVDLQDAYFDPTYVSALGISISHVQSLILAGRVDLFPLLIALLSKNLYSDQKDDVKHHDDHLEISKVFQQYLVRECEYLTEQCHDIASIQRNHKKYLISYLTAVGDQRLTKKVSQILSHGIGEELEDGLLYTEEFYLLLEYLSISSDTTCIYIYLSFHGAKWELIKTWLSHHEEEQSLLILLDYSGQYTNKPNSKDCYFRSLLDDQLINPFGMNDASRMVLTCARTLQKVLAGVQYRFSQSTIDIPDTDQEIWRIWHHRQTTPAHVVVNILNYMRILDSHIDWRLLTSPRCNMQYISHLYQILLTIFCLEDPLENSMPMFQHEEIRNLIESLLKRVSAVKGNSEFGDVLKDTGFFEQYEDAQRAYSAFSFNDPLFTCSLLCAWQWRSDALSECKSHLWSEWSTMGIHIERDQLTKHGIDVEHMLYPYEESWVCIKAYARALLENKVSGFLYTYLIHHLNGWIFCQTQDDTTTPLEGVVVKSRAMLTKEDLIQSLVARLSDKTLNDLLEYPIKEYANKRDKVDHLQNRMENAKDLKDKLERFKPSAQAS